jgi:putative FmdB family regulatory protein
MPTYVYACKKCEVFKDVSHGMFEEPQVECAKCGSLMNKKPTVSAVHFPSGGWSRGE